VTPLNRWQTLKGVIILALLVAGFLAAPIPREVLALGAAAVLLTSRRMASRDLISIANVIVIDQAKALGVRIGWREHARVGIPVTLVTLALAAGWLAWRAS
jgi:Na+/H+ antiporter NhaD/arsenite permease-like protein